MKQVPERKITSLLGTEAFFTALTQELPPVFSRETASRLMGGILTPKTLSNIDGLGNGPSVKVRLGKKIGYEKHSFIEWLRNKLRE